MSGGLRHQSDEKKRPSYLVGYKLADKATHPVKGTQCSCAEASSVLELMKFITPNTLTGADVLRDVEKVPQLMLVAVQCSGYKQARVPDAAVHHYIWRPAAHDGTPFPRGVAVLLLPARRSSS